MQTYKIHELDAQRPAAAPVSPSSSASSGVTGSGGRDSGSERTRSGANLLRDTLHGDASALPSTGSSGALPAVLPGPGGNAGVGGSGASSGTTSKMPRWFDDFEGYVASLPPLEAVASAVTATNAARAPVSRKDSDSLDQVRAQYGLQRKNSFMYAEELRGMARAELTRLRELICAMSAPFVLQDALKELGAYVKSAPDSDYGRGVVAALLPRCEVPESLVAPHASGSALGVALAKPLEALAAELNQVILDLGTKHALSKALRALSDFYQSEADRVNALGAKAYAAPRVLVSGTDAFIGQRLLHPNAAEALLHQHRRDNKHGLHAVIAYGGIHWKRAPSWPGYEFAVDALNKLVTGSGSPPAQLLKITRGGSEAWCYQAATTVEGALLLDVLEQRPELLSRLDAENYSLMYLLGILTNLQDGKPDNFIVRFNATTRLLEIVGIDNDHAFADPVVKTRDGHSLNVRHVLYFLPQARQRIDAKARDKFLTLTPEEVVLRWLEQLHKCNADWAALRDDGVLTRLDCTEMNLPIRLRKGEAAALLHRLREVRAQLQSDPSIAQHTLLQRVQPEVAAVVDALLQTTRTDRPDQGYAAFRRLFAMPALEKDADLQPLCQSCEPIRRAVAGEVAAPHVHDYSRTRTVSPEEAVADLFTSGAIDLEALARKSRKIQDLLFRELLPTMALPALTLKGADRFSDKACEALVRASKQTLRSLELVDCPGVAPSALRLLAECTLKPTLTLVRCAQCSPEAINMLRAAGLTVETKLAPRPDLAPTPTASAATASPTATTVTVGTAPSATAPANVADVNVSDAARTVAQLLEEAVARPARFRDALLLLARMDASEIARSRAYIAARARACGAVHAAVAAGELAVVKILVRGFGVDVNGWDVRTMTPLQVAAHANSVAGCKALVELGADVNRKGAQMRTPLVEALLHGAEDAALLFLHDYAGIVDLPAALPVPDARSPLHAAIAANMLRVAHHLLRAAAAAAPATLKAALHATSASGYNALHYAAEGRVEEAALLTELLDGGVALDLKAAASAGAVTPLLVCAMRGHLSLAKLLLARAGDARALATAVDHERRNALHLAAVHMASDEPSERARVTAWIDFMAHKFPELLEARDALGRTALAAAAKAGAAAAVAVLLRHGASVHVADASGHTPLHHAAALEGSSAVAVLQLLLQRSDAATLKTRNGRGLSALGRCVMLMHVQPRLRRQLVKLLMEAPGSLSEAVAADVDATLLHYAVRLGNVEAVQWLLAEARVDASVRDSKGYTPLHLACACGHPDVLRALLTHSGDKGSLDDRAADGDTPLITAVKGARAQGELVRLLLAHGAREDLENAKGESAMDVAQRRNLRDVVAALVDHGK